MQGLSAREGKALVITAFVAHAVLTELTGMPLDWTGPVSRAAHAVCNVPMPGQAIVVTKQPAAVESKKKR